MAEARTDTGWGMVGQDAAVASLRHALATERLSHAYLFTGPPGVGKATLARRLAQSLACEQTEQAAGAAPCLVCRVCRQIDAGAFPDVERIAVGGVCDERGHRDHGADNSTRIRICQVRRLERVASLAPPYAQRRVFVVDSAGELQTEAAHALLKTLEEPPATVLIVLLAADPEALLPTIRSRCQEIVLRPLPVAELAPELEARLDLPPDEALELARLARGRYGRATRLHTDPSLRVLVETVEADVRRISGAGRNERFDYAQQLARSWGRERESVLATLDIWRGSWRDSLHAAARMDAAGDSDALDGSAIACSPGDALRALRAAQRARDHLLENTNAQLALEVMMLDLPLLSGEVDGEEARTAAAPQA